MALTTILPQQTRLIQLRIRQRLGGVRGEALPIPGIQDLMNQITGRIPLDCSLNIGIA